MELQSRFESDSKTLEILVDTEIRRAHSWKSFQKPDSIADAIRLFTEISLWKDVAALMGMTPADLKTRIELVVDRRNKIAHEADIDPSFPGQRGPSTARLRRTL